MTGEIRLDDYGTEFKITMKDEDGNLFDLSNATTKQFIFGKPNGKRTIKNANLATDGKDGILRYVITSGEFDVAGEWRLQSFIVNPSGAWSSDISTFKVHKNV